MPATTLNPPARPATERIPKTKGVKGRDKRGKSTPKMEETPQISGKREEQDRNTTSWSEVVSKRTKKEKAPAAAKEAGRKQAAVDPAAKLTKQVQLPSKRKEPRIAAVPVTCPLVNAKKTSGRRVKK